MPKVRDPNRERAFLIYKENDGNIDLVEIASQLNLPDGTIRGWKSKDKWNDRINGTLPKNMERSKRNKKVTKPIADEVKQVIDNPELTDKQRLFCLNYVKCFNATKAYQKAYECSYESAMANGSDLLRNAKVKEQIQSLKQGKLNQSFLKTEDIVQRYIDIAYADITDYADFGTREVVFTKDTEQGVLSAVTEMSYVDAKPAWMVDGSLLSEVSMGKGGIKIKLLDQMKAMQWLSDHMDLLTSEQKARIEHMQNKDKLERERFEHQKEQDERSNF